MTKPICVRDSSDRANLVNSGDRANEMSGSEDAPLVQKNFSKRGKLFGGTVPPNNTLFGGTVPPNNTLFGGTVPPNSTLFGGTPDFERPYLISMKSYFG